MAKAPRKTTAKRQVRITRPALNESRAAGAPAPASAAATAPPPGAFYNPSEADASPATRAAAMLREPPMEQALRAAHNLAVADRMVEQSDLSGSADADISDHVIEGETLEQQVARIRTMRKPLGAVSLKLALDKRAGYKRHWFNDTGDRIGAALTNGWAHVKGRDGAPLKRAVGTGRDRGVLYAYAMEIPEVFWLEDMAERHRLAAEKISALKKSPLSQDPASGPRGERADTGKFYSPADAHGADPIDVRQH